MSFLFELNFKAMSLDDTPVDVVVAVTGEQEKTGYMAGRVDFSYKLDSVWNSETGDAISVSPLSVETRIAFMKEVNDEFQRNLAEVQEEWESLR